jgi:hypothetical protein
VNAGPELTPAAILSRATGPWPTRCAGFAPAPGGGYIAAPGITAVSRQVDKRIGSRGDDAVTVNLACEVLGLAQVNCVPVHRFCGPGGLLAGIDLLRPASLPDRLTTLVRDDGGSVPVFYLDPVAEATEGLLGRFPFQPGEHTMCAQFHRPIEGPAVAGAVLAIGIPEDRRGDAAVFMASIIADRKASAADLPARRLGTVDLADRAERAAWSVLAVGADGGRRYREIYAGAAAVPVLPGWQGTGLVAVPCLRLAAAAVPVPPEKMLEMTLDEWQAKYRYS